MYRFRVKFGIRLNRPKIKITSVLFIVFLLKDKTMWEETPEAPCDFEIDREEFFLELKKFLQYNLGHFVNKSRS
jgi:hypothetical protein